MSRIKEGITEVPDTIRRGVLEGSGRSNRVRREIQRGLRSREGSGESKKNYREPR